MDSDALYLEIREVVFEILADHSDDREAIHEESYLWTDDIMEIVEKHLNRG